MNMKQEPKISGTKPRRKTETKLDKSGKSKSLPNSQRLIQELQESQIELEKQSKELAQAQAAHKQAEETLWQVQANLEESQRISHLGSWVWDLASGKIHFSEEMFRLVGMVPHEVEITQEIFAKFLLPNEGEQILQKLLQSTDSSFPGIEHQFVQPDGKIRNVYSRIKAYRDENGRPLRLLGSTQDITERKQAEAEIQLLAKLPAESPNPILRVNADGVLLYINETGLSLLPQWSLQIGEFVPLKLLEAVLQSMSSETAQTLDLTHADRIFAFHIAPIIEAGYANLYGSDITDSWQVQALREAEEMQQSIFSSTPDSIIVVDLNGFIKFCNQVSADIHGYSSTEQLIGKKFIELVAEENRRSAMESMTRVLMNGVLKEVSFTGLKSNGEKFAAELSVSVLKNSLGSPSGFVGITKDITERKQTEEALQKSEERYHVLFDNMTEGFAVHQLIFDGNGEPYDYLFLDFNQAFEQLMGLKREDLVGRTQGEVLPDEDPFWFKTYCKVALTGESIHMEYYLSPLQRYYEVYAYRPAPNQFAVVFRDITERKLVEDALRDSEENLSKAQHYAHVGSWIWNIKTNQLKWSDEMYHIFGIDKSSFTGDLADVIAQAIHPDDRDKVEQANRDVREHGKPVPLEYHILWRNGTIRVVWEEAGELIFDNDGEPSLLSGVVQDITERKQAEEEIRRHLNELQVLYENGLVIGSLLDIREIGSRIIHIFEQSLSWHHGTVRLRREESDDLELVAFSLPSLKGDAAEVERTFNTGVTKVGQGLSGWVIQTGEPIRTGNVHLHPQYVDIYQGIRSGLYMPLKIGTRVIGAISIESEEPDAFTPQDERLLATLANQAAVAFENARLHRTARQEINQRKLIESLLADEKNQLSSRVEERTADLSRVNANLAHALRVRDEFLASMSHELRTPLTGILGLSEVMRLNVYGELNDKQQKALLTIEESGHHLLELINDILDLSRIEAGSLELLLAPCSIEDICQSSLHLAKGMANRKGQNVYYSPANEPVIIQADARRLKQILVNLLGNAIKFTPEKGELGLEVQANKDEGIVKLMVWDKGIGIKPENFNKLFKPFVQIDSSLAREYSGTGLGLSLVQRLTEMHNGGIEIESVFGEGSRFTIALPWSPQNGVLLPNASRPGTAELSSSITPFEHSKPPLVMLADDNETALQLVADYFEAKQARVIKVRSGIELLEKVSESHPDIILVDIQMPGMDGLETIRRVRAHADLLVAETPVIAVTALAMAGDRELCLRAGANEYMSKPVRLNELASTIYRLLVDKK